MVKDFDSQLKIYKEVTKEAVILDSTDTAYSKIQKAVKACQEYMLPVYIEIPRDMVDREIVVSEEKEESYLPDESAIKEATDEILLRITMAKGACASNDWTRNMSSPSFGHKPHIHSF